MNGETQCQDMGQRMNDIEVKLANENYAFLLSCIKNIEHDKAIDPPYLPYCEIIKRYCEDKSLQYYSIKTIIKNKVRWYYEDEERKLKQKKRKPEGGLCSYDVIAEACDITSDGIHYHVSLEHEALDEIILDQIMIKLGTFEYKEVANMLVAGYSRKDTERVLKISYYRLRKITENIKLAIYEVYEKNRGFTR